MEPPRDLLQSSSVVLASTLLDSRRKGRGEGVIKEGRREGPAQLMSSCDAPSSPKPTRSHLRFYTACWHTYTTDYGVLSYSRGAPGPILQARKPFSKRGDAHLAVHSLISRLPVPRSVGLPHSMLGSTCSLVQAKPAPEPLTSGPCSQVSSETVAS